MEGPNPVSIEENFGKAIDMLIELLSNPHNKVRETTGWLFTTLAKVGPGIFQNEAVFN